MKKTVSTIFILLIMLMLFWGFGRTLIAPEDINEYENRYAEKLTAFTPGNYLQNSFQDQMELALGDQLPYAEMAKEKYNYYSSGLVKCVFDFAVGQEPEPEKSVDELMAADENLVLSAASAGSVGISAKPQISDDDKNQTQEGDSLQEIDALEEPQPKEIPLQQYFKVSYGLSLCRQHLMYRLRPLEKEKKNLDKYIESINTITDKYPDIDFYMYYINKETDFDYSTGEYSGIDKYLLESVNIPDGCKRAFEIGDFNEFDSWFFRTDHHFCYAGAYKAYKDVLDMLLPEEIPVKPTGIVRIGEFAGLKAKDMGGEASYRENFNAYTFDFPELKFTINGAAAGNYGNQEGYIARAAENDGTCTGLSYGNYYGGDNGEIIIDNPNCDNGSILIFGESYDNAILKLLASHFSRIYSIDLRNYKAQNNKSFKLDNYIKEHNIDRILLIGNVDYYVQSAFRLINY